MNEEAGKQPKAGGLARRAVVFIVGFAISLAIGAAVERITEQEFLETAEAAQAEWIEAVSKTSPIGVAQTFWTEISGAFTGDSSSGAWSASGGKGHGIASPLVALAMTVWRLAYTSGLFGIIQLALAALAIAVFNYRRSHGDTILFDEYLTNLIGGPVAIVATASVIGLVLWGVMLGALYALSWITGLAAAAAGATGVVGFCWFCLTKLGEKGAEHIVTPKI